jgi:hypothetical protein
VLVDEGHLGVLSPPHSGQRVRVAFSWVSARNCYVKLP